MSEIILHHYDLSPFSEKIRRILAYKKLPWRGVEQPMMAPKPKLSPLTGGYRRIPVLQIGADVYCDTARIARRLEASKPDPPCLPRALGALPEIVADWADRRFFMMAVPPVLVDLLPNLPPEFIADRRAMSPSFSAEGIEQAAPHAATQVLVVLDGFDRQLRDRKFFLGDAFTVADAACFHSVWFLKNAPKLFAAVTERRSLAAWFERIEGFGPGEMRPMEADEALEIARRSSPSEDEPGDAPPAGGPRIGERIGIVADDYGPEETTGTLDRLTSEEIAVRRADPDLGEVRVHFPRAGYRVVPR